MDPFGSSLSKTVIEGDPSQDTIATGGDSNHHDTCVAIVLVNWNGWKDCVDCIDSLLGGIVEPFHVYLVDNESSDESVERIIEWCESPRPLPEIGHFPGVRRYSDGSNLPSVSWRLIDEANAPALRRRNDCCISLIRSGGNLGFAGGNNIGIRLAMAADAQWIWLLNSDTVVHHGALASLLARARALPDAGIIGSTLVYYHEPQTVQALGGGWLNRRTFVPDHIGGGTHLDQVPRDPHEVEAKMAYVMGASMLVSRRFVENVGLMQEDYFLYFEELDWAQRGKDKFRQGWAPTSVVWHKAGGSTSKEIPAFSMRLMTQNRLKFVARFFPDHIGSARRQLAWEYVRHVLKGRSSAARVVRAVLWPPRERSAADGKA
ncbi:MAG: glycosyltransferase family 2 protein [Rhodoferax sp.]|nr:glycosyltransferase family 2 protein [Rhodoferax sp.]